MARNDVYLNINSLSPADAVVTGQQDMTAATIPELVLGDTPTFNFYFTDNTNVWPSWAGNAAYTLTWALSDAVAGDFAPAATTGNATPITGGWSVVLPLNSYDLVGLLNTKRVGQPYPVQNLWQQLRVTDPSGNEITRAMVWTPVRYRAISDTQNTESASPTGGRFVTVNNVNELTTPTDAQFYAANPVPTSALGTASNGQLFIGNGTGFTKATLTAGTGVAITNGSGSITIDATNAQELLTATVTNAEATPITKGQVVYIFGATGNRPSVKLAYNTGDATSAKTFGVVSDASIAAGGTGTVTCVGVVDGLNLGTYSDGDTVYLGATPGSITATKPYAPNHLVYVGIIERANAGNGELYVRIQNGYELDEIHDVQILTPPASGSLLIRDNTLSLWKAATLTAGTNIAVTNGDAAVTVGLTGTVAVANGGTGVTTSTGSGSVVLSTSPSLTTPILGTPQSGTLSNCTGLPVSTGISGFGTNVATALASNVGSAGAFVVNGGALGTPLSGTLTNATGLPISTGVSGLGSNVASFLATPSSANLAAAVTDETGTGALVFANTPTLVTPNIGAATGTSFNLTGSGTLGTTLVVNGTTDSSSKDTGAIVTEGGLGVEKSATIGGNLTVSSTGTSAAKIGQGFAGFAEFSNSAGFGASGTYALLQNNSGQTFLNTASGTNLSLRVANTDVATFNSTTTTVAGNLTVSGTGNSTFAGNVTASGSADRDIRATSTAGEARVTLDYYGTGGYGSFQIFRDGVRKWRIGVINNNDASPPLQFYNETSGEFGRFSAGGNFLLKSDGVDSSNGKLQLATHNTSAGGIGFGTDVSLFRNAANSVQFTTSYSGASATVGKLLLDNSYFNSGTPSVNAIKLNVYGGSAAGEGYGIGVDSTAALLLIAGNSGGNGQIKFATGSGASTALTLDSSQNATFAGSIKTVAPTGGTAKPWELGEAATVSPTSPNRTIRVEIDGTVYYIHAKTTND